MNATKKFFLLICCLLFLVSYSKAQSIKAQAKQQKREEQYKQEQRDKGRKEEARIQKAQLNLTELLRLLRSKDLEYVDKYLSDKGWKLNATNVKEADEYEYEAPSNYKEVTWALEKNSYNDLARGWFKFYLYSTYDNAISYLFADESHLEKLKEELINSNYKRVYPTDAIERGLESVYRNDLYEVYFKKRVKGKYEEGADINYSFFIYNYKQKEEREAEAERIAREKAEREEKYQNAVQRAQMAYSRAQYSEAKQAYIDALELKPENREILIDKIAEIDITVLCEEADRLFKRRQYEKAKEKYVAALDIRPNKKIEVINGKISEIANIQSFLTERTYKQYDYKTIERSDYISKDTYIKDQLRKNLLANAENLPKTTVTIICQIDTLGNASSDYTTSIQHPKLNKLLDEIVKAIKLKRCYILNYAVNAKAEFIYTIEYNHSISVVNKNHRENSSSSYITGLGYNAPYGKYTFDVNRTTINGQLYNDNKLIKARTHGAENALLSLLVPGLGDHRVSYGKRKGIGVTLSTYALIGGGIGLKVYSNREYKKYHTATTQDAMDNHYKNANYSNQAFYGCLVAGGIIWLSDIIWVIVKGAKNTKEMKVYRRSHLSTYYDPNMQAACLYYTLNF